MSISRQDNILFYFILEILEQLQVLNFIVLEILLVYWIKNFQDFCFAW